MNHFIRTFRCTTYKRANLQRELQFAVLGALLAVSWVVGPTSSNLNARPQALPLAVTDRITYNAGEEVWIRIVPASPQAVHTLDSYLFAVRYVGEGKPLLDGIVLGGNERGAASPSTSYRLLWKVPLDARTGRYEVDLRVQDPKSHEVIQEIPRICSFVVHRQLIQIVSAETGQPYYTAGDMIGCNVKIENLSDRPRARTSPRILRALLAMDRPAKGADWDGHREVAE